MTTPPNFNPRGPGQRPPGSSDIITNDPKRVDQNHQNSDLNSSKLAQHHTLGAEPNQASPGNHIHDGSTSKQIQNLELLGNLTVDGDVTIGKRLIAAQCAGIELVSFTTLTSITIPIMFDTPFSAAPAVVTTISTGDGNAAHWDSRGINISSSGFTLFLFQETGGVAKTWSNLPVSWIAMGVA